MNNLMRHGYEGYNFKYFLFFVVFYMMTFPLVAMSLHKPVNLWMLHVQASTLIYPLTFFFADIIFEVYGYQIGRQLIWCQVPGTIYYQSILIFILYGVPVPEGWNHQDAYEYVFKGMDIVGFFGSFGLVTAFFLNGFLISKLKILLNGKYFWLRSILATTLSELIQLSIGLLGTWFAHIWTLDKLIFLSANVIIYRICLTIILAWPANIVAQFLKKAEKLDVYDINTNFSPFKLSIQK